jgi:hypothetical protein
VHVIRDFIAGRGLVGGWRDQPEVPGSGRVELGVDLADAGQPWPALGELAGVAIGRLL